MESSSPVAVVGAGGSGLLAAAALRRRGVEFEVLEARDGIGGTWRYDESGTGSACYRSLVANTSNLRMSVGGRRISGRPWQYAGHEEMLAHLEELADADGLRPHIQCGWDVAQARADGDSWTLVERGGEERRYRAVVCAIPSNGRPRMAGETTGFGGEQLHSAAYRTPDRFTGKAVLIVGLGTSGGEVAGDIAGRARSVTVAVREPLWMMTRRLGGFPIDWLDDPLVDRLLPWSMRRSVLAGLCKATTGRVHKHGLPRPTRRCGDDIIAISDTFPRAVRSGFVEFKPAVEAASGRLVRFADGTSAEFDTIVHATGYEPATGFLAEHARPLPEKLYRGIAHTEAPGLFFVGMFEAHRALLPVAEDQAAWAADVLGGRIALPDRGAMRAAAVRYAAGRRRDFGDRRPYMVDHARYRAMLRRDGRTPRRRKQGSRSSGMAGLAHH